MKEFLTPLKVLGGYLFTVVVLGLSTASLKAADVTSSTAVSAATALTILDGANYNIKSLIFYNGNTTNAGTFWFYDSDGNATNRILGAYTTYSTAASTNTTVWTNAAGLLITNITVGVATTSSAVGQSTNELLKIVGVNTVPANGNKVLTDLNRTPLIGFTIYSTVDGTLDVTYEQTAP